MKVSGSSNGFKQPEPGTYNAICTKIIDLGTQETTYQGETKKGRKVLIGWEIDCLMEDGRPFLVMNRYTASIHPKSTLCKMLESWRGLAFTEEERKCFDLSKVLLKPAMITLVKNGDYTNVSSVAKIPKGMKEMEMAGSLTHFELDAFNQQVFDSLSQNLRDTISSSPEYKKAIGQPEQDQTPAEAIPF